VELQERRRVRITEVIPISRPTVTGLIETFRTAFTGKDKPVRVLYIKGEDLIVERTVLTTDSPGEDPFLTPYQMVRQHSELEIQEAAPALIACCRAAQEIRKQGFDLTGIVSRSPEEVNAWLPEELDLGKTFGVEVFIDPECPEGCLFFCGSSSSPMIRDIEKSILCRMD